MTTNIPTAAGRELGEQIARMLGYPESCCHACAGRVGSGPNGCESTLLDFIASTSDEGGVFLCHVHGGPCAAWVEARKQMAAGRDSPKVNP